MHMKNRLSRARYSRFLQSIVCAFTFSASGLASAEVAAEIQIDKQPGSNPWSHLQFPDANVEFQFAVISDNTGGAYPGVFDAAMTKLNLIQPEFVMSVGDLIEGHSNNPEALIAEWEEIDASVDKLDMPFFYVVGNHDKESPVTCGWRNRKPKDSAVLRCSVLVATGGKHVCWYDI